MDKIKTGVEGLDEMLNGGIPKRRHVALCGGPGTGKTLMCMQFLYKGASEYGEAGAYISLEEKPEAILANVRSVFPKWAQLDEMVKSKKLSIAKMEPPLSEKKEGAYFDALMEEVEGFVEKGKVKRVVIDSMTMWRLTYPSKLGFRKNVYELLEFFAGFDINVMFTAELPSSSRESLKFSLEQFMADGVIALYNIQPPGQQARVSALEILKMRGTGHSRRLVPLRFGADGITVYPDEKVY